MSRSRDEWLHPARDSPVVSRLVRFPGAEWSQAPEVDLPMEEGGDIVEVFAASASARALPRVCSDTREVSRAVAILGTSA